MEIPEKIHEKILFHSQSISPNSMQIVEHHVSQHPTTKGFLHRNLADCFFFKFLMYLPPSMPDGGDLDRLATMNAVQMYKEYEILTQA